MDDIDEILRSAGERWRDTLPRNRDPDLGSLHTRRTSAWGTASMSLGLLSVAVMLVGGGLLARSIGNPSDSSRDQGVPPSLAGAIVLDGDMVQGSGTVVRVDGDFFLCLADGVRDRRYEAGTAPLPSCSPISVRLLGLDPSKVSNWQERGTAGFAYGVSIVGTWTASGIVVESVGTVPPTPQPRFVLPCDPPTGSPLTSGDTGLDALEREVEARPAVYGGIWIGYVGGLIPGDSRPPDAVVVGIAGDLEDEVAHLRRLFGGALCVTQVSYSAEQLNALAARLHEGDRTVQTTVEVDLNRVRVRATVLDDSLAKGIGEEAPLTILDPLVWKE